MAFVMRSIGFLFCLRGEAEFLWWWCVRHISTNFWYFNIYNHFLCDLCDCDSLKNGEQFRRLL